VKEWKNIKLSLYKYSSLKKATKTLLIPAYMDKNPSFHQSSERPGNETWRSRTKMVEWNIFVHYTQIK